MNPESVDKRILRSTSKLPVKMGKESLRLVPENIVKFNEVKQYPYLNENNPGIRFSPFTGEVFISTYRYNLRKESATEKIVLMQRGKKPSQEIFQRWNQYSDVESAIRSSGHVLDRYGKDGGKMVENTRGIIDLTKRLLSKFESGEVNKENIEKITQETFLELSLLGFNDSEKPIRQKLALQITSAAGKDKLERVNPLISRTRLASAWMKAIRELLAAKKIREKFSAVATDLLSERAIERFYLCQAVILVDDILQNQDAKGLEEKISELKTFSSIFLRPEKIKVSPYRKPALLFNYSLFGVKNESEKDLLIITSANEIESVDLLGFTPIDKILKGALFTDNACWEIQERLSKPLESIKSSLDRGAEDLDKNKH